MTSRREFFSLLGGAAAAWGQQAGKVARIGVLMNLTAEDAEGQARLGSFMQGLQQLGWSIGRTIGVDVRWGGGNTDLYRKHAEELLWM